MKLYFGDWTLIRLIGSFLAGQVRSLLLVDVLEGELAKASLDGVTHAQTDGTVAQVLALPPHSKKAMGSIPAWGAVGSGGQVLPGVHSAQVGYLPGLSVWSLHVLPVFTRGFLQ